MRLSLFVGIAFFSVVQAHPAFYQHFERIVNADDCIKSCMEVVTAHGEELSLLKNADLLHYFGQHEKVCKVIEEARVCIDKCGTNSNPFALDSMQTLCRSATVEKVASLKKCIADAPTSIYDECSKNCGNYNEVNDAVHEMTKAIGVDAQDPLKVQPILAKTDQACGVFKCMARCNVDAVSRVCSAEQGAALQELFQSVLDAHRRDLERLHILESMARSTPPQCSYMYEPTVMFNATPTPPTATNADEDANLILAQTQMRILMQQLDLLQRQEKLLEKQNAKLDMELKLLQLQQQQQNPMGGPGFFPELK